VATFFGLGCERQSLSRVDRGHFFFLGSWVLGSWVSQSLSGVNTLCLAHASFHLALRTYVRDWEEDLEWLRDGICVIVWNCVCVDGCFTRWCVLVKVKVEMWHI
jgi:hypothetical protein